jgi:L-cysteine S-thiosulfotransferase
MKKLLTLLALVGLASVAALPAQADPQSDLKEFQGYFKKKFPGVKFDEFANGLYGLPEFKDYRKMWESYNEFPPYELGVERGKQFWNKKFANGGSFTGCVKKGVIRPANTYPRWDKASKSIRVAELDINACLKMNGEKEFTDLDKDQKQRVALAEVTRRGQLNFACNHCHMELAGKDLGGAQPLSAGLGHTVAWPAQRLEWARLETIMQRYATCNSQVRAAPAKHYSDTYLTLQLYETYMSSGLPLTAPAMRN